MTNTASTTNTRRWVTIYALGCSVLTLVLLMALVIGGRTNAADSVADARRQTLEAEKQDKAHSRFLQEQQTAARNDEVRAQAAAKRRIALARIEGLERHLIDLRRSLSRIQTEKSAHSARVKSYALNHKAAIAAMGIAVGGVASAADSKNDLNDNQKAVAGLLGVGAGLYALANGEECMEVADTMAKAAAIQADYDTRLKRLQRQLSTSKSQVAKERAAMR